MFTDIEGKKNNKIGRIVFCFWHSPVISENANLEVSLRISQF
jgi:hypothetical protein